MPHPSSPATADLDDGLQSKKDYLIEHTTTRFKVGENVRGLRWILDVVCNLPEQREDKIEEKQRKKQVNKYIVREKINAKEDDWDVELRTVYKREKDRERERKKEKRKKEIDR